MIVRLHKQIRYEILIIIIVSSFVKDASLHQNLVELKKKKKKKIQEFNKKCSFRLYVSLLKK